MNVLISNGSSREGSNTLLALKEMQAVFETEGIDTEILDIGKLDIRGCLACNWCCKNEKCAIDDIVIRAQVSQLMRLFPPGANIVNEATDKLKDYVVIKVADKTYIFECE